MERRWIIHPSIPYCKRRPKRQERSKLDIWTILWSQMSLFWTSIGSTPRRHASNCAIAFPSKQYQTKKIHTYTYSQIDTTSSSTTSSAPKSHARKRMSNKKFYESPFRHALIKFVCVFQISEKHSDCSLKYLEHWDRTTFTDIKQRSHETLTVMFVPDYDEPKRCSTARTQVQNIQTRRRIKNSSHETADNPQVRHFWSDAREHVDDSTCQERLETPWQRVSDNSLRAMCWKSNFLQSFRHELQSCTCLQSQNHPRLKFALSTYEDRRICDQLMTSTMSTSSVTQLRLITSTKTR